MDNNFINIPHTSRYYDLWNSLLVLKFSPPLCFYLSSDELFAFFLNLLLFIKLNSTSAKTLRLHPFNFYAHNYTILISNC